MATQSPTSKAATPSSSSVAEGTKESFVGHWWVHGGQLEIKPDNTAVQTGPCDVTCLETHILSLSPVANGTRMSVIITEITYTGPNGEPIANPYPGESAAVGDSSYLEFVAPHLLKETIIESSLPDIDQLGNHYWCGDDLEPPLTRVCGA
jgi:hypothetical protein